VSAQRAVLDAARSLLDARRVSEITIDALAREAGVGRPTIYRWWPSATAVVLDAFLEDVTATFADEPAGGTARDALTRQILGIVRVLRGAQGRVIAELLAAGQSDPALLAMFRDRFLLLRRRAVRDILERGISSGEFERRLDADFIIDLITGPAYLRHLSGHQPISDAFARQLAAHIVEWVSKKPR
jgi:AcrR family transcriptional regulator